MTANDLVLDDNHRSWRASRTWSWLAGGPERSWAAWFPAAIR